MKPNRLNRLIGLARQGQPTPNEATPTAEAPPGFANRVVALWAGSASPSRLSRIDLWERLSWWGSGAAAAACLFVAVFQSAEPEPTSFDLLMGVAPMESPF